MRPFVPIQTEIKIKQLVFNHKKVFFEKLMCKIGVIDWIVRLDVKIYDFIHTHNHPSISFDNPRLIYQLAHILTGSNEDK